MYNCIRGGIKTNFWILNESRIQTRANEVKLFYGRYIRKLTSSRYPCENALSVYEYWQPSWLNGRDLQESQAPFPKRKRYIPIKT